MTAVLTVIAGGRNRAEIIQVERSTWDEIVISRTVAAAERLSAAELERRLLLGAMHALSRPQPDVDAAERLLSMALRLVVQEATRAAADLEPEPEPVPALSLQREAA